MTWATLLTSKWTWIGLAIVAAAVGLVWFYYDAKAAGAAGAIAAAAVEATRRAAKANEARSEVKPNDQDTMRRDPYNRDSGL